MLILLALACAPKPDGPALPVDSGTTADDTEVPEDTATDTASEDTSEPTDDSGDPTDDTGPGQDTAEDTAPPDTAEPGCLDDDVVVDEVSASSADGIKDLADGLSGHVVLGQDASGTWDAYVHGRSAESPLPMDTDGAVARYTALGTPDAWLWLDPDEGELELVALGDLDEDAGVELIVGMEHPGLIGARVSVHATGWSTRPAHEGEWLFTSEATGGSPVVMSGDVDGDGLDDLGIAWAEQLELWTGPIPEGSYTEDDGDRHAEGKARQWGVAGDVDADGYADLLLATTDGVAVLLGGADDFSGDLSTPDHRLGSGEDGADQRGIALGDPDGDGVIDIALTLTALAAGDTAVRVHHGLSGGSTELSTDETGRYQLAWADLDGDGADSLLLGRVPSSTATGGLLVFADLAAEPVHIAPERTSGLLGAAFSEGASLLGDASEQLVAVDPFGAGDWDARLYLLDPCGDTAD